MSVLERLAAVESRSMRSALPVVWARAEGATVWDDAGKPYIDFTSGIFVANVGHANPHVMEAVRDVLFLHSYTFATEIRARYLEALTRWSGFEKAFLLSSGTEATEAALKLMRLHGQEIGKRRLGVISIEGAMHGRTMGAQMMGGNMKARGWIGCDLDIHRAVWPTEEAWGTVPGHPFGLAPNDVCGVMLETYQGWSARFYPLDFVQSLREFCSTYGILLCFDEMQSGFGRTGREFGFEHYHVIPDLVCVGKAMGGGVPLSGVLGSSRVLDIPEQGEMSSTHSANPLACAAGIAVIEEMDRLNLVVEADRKGEILAKALGELAQRFQQRIAAINGAGLVAAIIFKGDEAAVFAQSVAERCAERGLIVVCTGRESLKIGPPLVIDDERLVDGVRIIGESIAEAA